MGKNLLMYGAAVSLIVVGYLLIERPGLDTPEQVSERPQAKHVSPHSSSGPIIAASQDPQQPALPASTANDPIPVPPAPGERPPYKKVKLPSIESLTRPSKDIDAAAMQQAINEDDQLIQDMDQLIEQTGLPADVTPSVTADQVQEKIKRLQEQLAEEQKKQEQQDAAQAAPGKTL